MSENPFQAPLETSNPYAPELLDQATQSVQIDGDCLVIPSGVVLPNRCVKTNVPTEPSDQHRKRLYWASPWVFMLILLNLLILLIVYFVTRKACDVTFSESPESRGRRRMRVFIAALVFVASTLGMISAIVTEAVAGLWLSLVCFALALIGLLIVSQGPIRPVKFRDGRFWMKGFSPEYLYDLANGNQ